MTKSSWCLFLLYLYCVVVVWRFYERVDNLGVVFGFWSQCDVDYDVLSASIIFEALSYNVFHGEFDSAASQWAFP